MTGILGRWSCKLNGLCSSYFVFSFLCETSTALKANLGYVIVVGICVLVRFFPFGKARLMTINLKCVSET
jgi:hypothetical protein